MEEELALRQSFETVQSLKVNTCFPLLLSLHRARDFGQLSAGDMIAAVELLESFLVKRAVCDLPTNSYNLFFGQLCREFPENSALEWLRSQLLEGSGNRRWPSDDEVKASVLARPMYQAPSVALLVLKNIEVRVCAHKESGALPNSLQIEHIMPQTLTEPWQQTLGPDWTEIHRRLRDTLGNLTLTGYNAEMSNDPFSIKRQFYADSHLEITKHIANSATWSESEIISRGAWLAAGCIKVWPR